MPTLRYSAPGRINLMGEHTDYNMGFALPIALPQRTVVSYIPDDTDAISVRSDHHHDEVRIPLDTSPGEVGGWAAYVAGVLWALRRAGHLVSGGAMSIAGGVEIGAGLASSAALECAVLGVLTAATGSPVDRVEQAKIARAAENDYVGAPTGLLDQLAALYGRPRRALLIDFRAITVKPVPFDPDARGVALLVINSRSPHQHAGGGYATRRASCERAAAALGVASLREVQNRGTPALEALADVADARRARHVLTENQRVLDLVAALHDCDFAKAGRLLTASHASMRDDFEITTAHIDLIAEAAVRAGALGARMTGGGFGGCVIALVAADDDRPVGNAVREAVSEAGYPQPTIMRTCASAGAG